MLAINRPIRRSFNFLGFTLIELMITVAIVAILASVATPSYFSYIRKTNRTAIKGDLEALSSELEKRFVVEFSYLKANGGIDNGPPIATLFPQQGPISGDNALYNFVFTNLTDASYLVEAIPIADRSQAPDGKLTIDQTGRRCWHQNNSNTCTLW
jgi:type IV pilus assembly protein PilE